MDAKEFYYCYNCFQATDEYGISLSEKGIQHRTESDELILCVDCRGEDDEFLW